MTEENVINIPQDMIIHQSESGGTVLSIRDFMIALGATDEQMAERDRIDVLMAEILTREPWRRNAHGIDWSGTEMEAIHRESSEKIRKMLEENMREDNP